MPKLRVQQSTWLAEDVVRVELRDPAGADLSTWEPGAHVVLNLPNGVVREYSLCGDPGDRRTWSIAVLREPDSRGGSAWVHERLTPGTVLEVDGPRNDFPLEPAARHLLIAGGIGITPVLPMARSLAASGSDWSLLYCGRSRSRMAFVEELTALGGERLRIHADDEQGGPPDLAAALAAAPDSLVYCCGPEPLIAGVEAALGDPQRLRVERFRAPTAAAPAHDDAAFDVVCAGSGTRVRVAADASVLDALAAAGIAVPSSCHEGVCGTCETKVLAGEIEHRDFVLSDQEKARGDTMLICVSRCRSPELVLDLP